MSGPTNVSTDLAPPFSKLDPADFETQVTSIPALQELAAVDQWVCWRPKRGDGGKWTKVPCLPNGRICDPHEKTNRRPLAECIDGVRAGPVYGVGFVTTADDPYVLIDFDHCRDLEAGTLDDESDREVKALASYAEVSVSGTGVHVIAKLDDPERLLLDGADGGKREGIEIYRAKRFFTFTGEHLAGTETEIDEGNDAVQSLWRRRVKPEDHKAGSASAEAAEVVLPAELPELDQKKLKALLDNEPKFRASWECRRVERNFKKADGTPDWSAYDLSLATFAALAGWLDGQIQALLYAHRKKHGGPLDARKTFRVAYITGTIAKARAKAEAWHGKQQARQEAGAAVKPPSFVADEIGWTHAGLTNEFAATWADDARHVALWNRWLFWDGTRWALDEQLRSTRNVRLFLEAKARALIAAAATADPGREPGADGVDDDKAMAKAMDRAKTAAKWVLSNSTITAVASLARGSDELLAGPDQWDLDHRLLGTPAGVIDLRTGELHAAQREAFITKRTAISPAPLGTPTPPMWMRFLERICRHDPELPAYLQRVTGYSATGLTVEQKLFLAYGEGQNGKRVLFNTLYGILGDYSKAAAGDLLIASNALKHPTELAALRGARLVLMSEVPDNAMWNEALLKRLTGEDPIPARFMHQDFFEYLPAFTPILQVNELPRFVQATVALRRRMELIPFSQTIPEDEKDEHLAEKLRAEWPGILRWMLDGAVAYLQGGLRPPQSVQIATEVYLARFDLLSGWLADCCETGPGAKLTGVSALHSHYASWCVGRGGRSMTRKAFSIRLERDFKKVARSAGMFFPIEITAPAGDD